MVGRYLDSTVPPVTQHDAEIAALALQVQEEVSRAFGEFRLNVALDAIWKLVGRMNKLIDEKAPWTLARESATGSAESAEALNATLYACLEATRIVAIFLYPFMPFASEVIAGQLGLPRKISEMSWEDLAWGGTPAGTRVGPPRPVFPRIQDLTVEEAVLQSLASSNIEAEVSTIEKERTNTVSDEQPAVRIAAAPGTPVVPTPGALEPQTTINIEDFMKEYNKDKGYSYIFSNIPDMMYYKDTAYNITADVIRGLNAMHKKKN